MWSLLNSVEHFEVDLLLWDDGGVLIQQNAFKFSFPEYKIRQNNFFQVSFLSYFHYNYYQIGKMLNTITGDSTVPTYFKVVWLPSHSSLSLIHK